MQSVRENRVNEIMGEINSISFDGTDKAESLKKYDSLLEELDKFRLNPSQLHKKIEDIIDKQRLCLGYIGQYRHFDTEDVVEDEEDLDYYNCKYGVKFRYYGVEFTPVFDEMWYAMEFAKSLRNSFVMNEYDIVTIPYNEHDKGIALEHDTSYWGVMKKESVSGLFMKKFNMFNLEKSLEEFYEAGGGITESTMSEIVFDSNEDEADYVSPIYAVLINDDEENSPVFEELRDAEEFVEFISKKDRFLEYKLYEIPVFVDEDEQCFYADDDESCWTIVDFKDIA